MKRALQADLASTPELREFTAELRAWLDANLTEEFRSQAFEDPMAASGEAFERRRAWQRILHSGGWAGVHWPAEYGGRSAGLLEYAIYLLECAEAGAPEPVNIIGINMIGPTLIQHGSHEQQLLLAEILAADTIWCQLYSEPDAGSDLGAIRTTATRCNGGWAVNGQKIWTSLGPMADLGFLLARTSGSGLEGLSCFIVDMRAPGVTVRGLRQMSGETHFSEVFLDDVELPDDAIVGREGKGWSVAVTMLMQERTTAILGRHATTLRAADHLLTLAGDQPTFSVGRDRALSAWVEAQVFHLSGLRGVAEASDGVIPPVSYLQRFHWGLVNRRIYEAGMGLYGGRAVLDQGAHDREANDWSHLFLASRGWTIGGGTSEIQRNMVGERVLCLPREPWPGKASRS